MATAEKQQQKNSPIKDEPLDDDKQDDFSDEYEDDYSDDDDDQGQDTSGKAVQARQRGGQTISSTDKPPAPKQKKGIDDEEGLKLKLDINLDIEVELKARIHGDLTLALLMADDKSRKAAIIKHMNNDHARSLSLYLRAYCAVSPRAAQSPILEDIRLTDMIISAQGSRYIIPFTPPLASISDTRARVVAMHKESLRRLNLSDTKITTYLPPQGPQVIGFAFCLTALVAYSRRANFEPGSVLYDTLDLGTRAPGFTEFSVKWQPWVFGILAGLHAFEAAVLLGWMRLRKHGVKIFSGLWWTWIVLGFVEGFPAWMRFDAEVKRIENEGGHEKST